MHVGENQQNSNPIIYRFAPDNGNNDDDDDGDNDNNDNRYDASCEYAYIRVPSRIIGPTYLDAVVVSVGDQYSVVNINRQVPGVHEFVRVGTL